MIPPLCASLSPVLAGPEGCSRGRWRSGPSKWRHTATLGGRGQGAPRTCRCIETSSIAVSKTMTSCQGAPRTCRCIETQIHRTVQHRELHVREHHAPVGALRPEQARYHVHPIVREHHAPVGALRPYKQMATWAAPSGQGAPRTCRCIETLVLVLVPDPQGRQGAPRTCRCIETIPSLYKLNIA